MRNRKFVESLCGRLAVSVVADDKLPVWGIFRLRCTLVLQQVYEADHFLCPKKRKAGTVAVIEYAEEPLKTIEWVERPEASAERISSTFSADVKCVGIELESALGRNGNGFRFPTQFLVDRLGP